MYLCFHATNQGKLVVEKNIHCQSIPFELDKFHFLCDGLTEAQRRFLERDCLRLKRLAGSDFSGPSFKLGSFYFSLLNP